MINLLFFASDYAVGLTTVLAEQVLELKKQDCLNLVSAASENEMEPGLRDRLYDAGVQLNIIPGLDVPRDFKRLSAAIGDIIRKNEIQIVNVHNNWQLALVEWVRFSGISKRKFKIIYTIHGYRNTSAWKPFFAIGLIGTALLCWADRVISMSGYVSKKFWFVRYKTDLVYYIMNKPEFRKTKNEIVTEGLRIVFPAQFRPGKNQSRLIDVIARYIRETGDRSIRVWLPGGGDLLPRCVQKVQAMGLTEQIIFPGLLPHKEVIALYEAANIGLAMTDSETYGRCIAEPFALGRCVVTSRTGIAEDIIRHGENGFIFDTSRELLQILLLLHEHPELIKKNAEQAFVDKEIFAPSEVIRSYVAVLNKTL